MIQATRISISPENALPGWRKLFPLHQLTTTFHVIVRYVIQQCCRCCQWALFMSIARAI